MVIETKRLRLRPYEICDAEWHFSVSQTDEVREYLSAAYESSFNDCLNTIKYYYLKGDFVHDFYFVIEDKENCERLGFLHVTNYSQKEFDMAAYIGKEYRGKGYISEAVEKFAESMPEGTVLQFMIKAKNRASLRSVQKLKGIEELTLSDSEADIRVFILQC